MIRALLINLTISAHKSQTQLSDVSTFGLIFEVPYEVCRMGGSVRCLSYQVVGDIADRLVTVARNSAD